MDKLRPNRLQLPPLSFSFFPLSHHEVIDYAYLRSEMRRCLHVSNERYTYLSLPASSLTPLLSLLSFPLPLVSYTMIRETIYSILCYMGNSCNVSFQGSSLKLASLNSMLR